MITPPIGSSAPHGHWDAGDVPKKDLTQTWEDYGGMLSIAHGTLDERLDYKGDVMLEGVTVRAPVVASGSISANSCVVENSEPYCLDAGAQLMFFGSTEVKGHVRCGGPRPVLDGDAVIQGKFVLRDGKADISCLRGTVHGGVFIESASGKPTQVQLPADSLPRGAQGKTSQFTVTHGNAGMRAREIARSNGSSADRAVVSQEPHDPVQRPPVKGTPGKASTSLETGVCPSTLEATEAPEPSPYPGVREWTVRDDGTLFLNGGELKKPVEHKGDIHLCDLTIRAPIKAQSAGNQKGDIKLEGCRIRAHGMLAVDAQGDLSIKRSTVLGDVRCGGSKAEMCPDSIVYGSMVALRPLTDVDLIAGKVTGRLEVVSINSLACCAPEIEIIEPGEWSDDESQREDTAEVTSHEDQQTAVSSPIPE